MVFTARLTVLGSLNMDISVTVPDLPVPGATVLGRAAVFAPGGKGANQAVAAARLAGDAGMSVAMIGCTGDDEFGRTLRSALRAEGIDDSRVRTVAGVPTGIAMITVDHAGENMITVAPGANHEVSTGRYRRPRPVEPGRGRRPGAATAPAGGGRSAFRDVLVISAEVPIPVISAALAASAGRALRVLNLAPAPSRAQAAELVAAGPDWLVVNESEAAAVLGRGVAGLAEAAAAAADLVAAGARNAVVTAGAAGAAYCGPQARARPIGRRWRPPSGRPPHAAARPAPSRSRVSRSPPSTPWARATRSSARSRSPSRPAFRRSTRSPPPPRPARRRPPGPAPSRACRARPTSFAATGHRWPVTSR